MYVPRDSTLYHQEKKTFVVNVGASEDGLIFVVISAIRNFGESSLNISLLPTIIALVAVDPRILYASNVPKGDCMAHRDASRIKKVSNVHSMLRSGRELFSWGYRSHSTYITVLVCNRARRNPKLNPPYPENRDNSRSSLILSSHSCGVM